jgi:hypothetical protein
MEVHGRSSWDSTRARRSSKDGAACHEVDSNATPIDGRLVIGPGPGAGDHGEAVSPGRRPPPRGRTPPYAARAGPRRLGFRVETSPARRVRGLFRPGADLFTDLRSWVLSQGQAVTSGCWQVLSRSRTSQTSLTAAAWESRTDTPRFACTCQGRRAQSVHAVQHPTVGPSLSQAVRGAQQPVLDNSV